MFITFVVYIVDSIVESIYSLSVDLINLRITSPRNFGALHYVKSLRIRSFFSTLFSRIRTEFGQIHRISPYSIQTRKNTEYEKKFNTKTFRAVLAISFCLMLKQFMTVFIASCLSFAVGIVYIM